MRKRMWNCGVVAALAAMSCILASSAGARTLAGPGGGAEAVVTSVSPTHAMAGQLVTIYGQNLNTTKSVTFGTVPSQSVVADPSGYWVRAVVPTGVPAGSVFITLDNHAAMKSGANIGPITIDPGSVTPVANPAPSATTGSSTGAGTKVVVAPRITVFSPAAARVGSKVRITGTHLNGALWVKFGGLKAKFTSSSPTTIFAFVPKRAHSGKIMVHTSGGTGVSTNTFRVVGASV